MTVEDGGSAKDAEVGSGGRLIVSGGAQADNITVTEGIMYVMNDAVANYTIVNDGASMFVENNGKVLNTSVVGSKIEFVGHVHNDLDSYFTLTNNSVMVVGGGFWNHGVFNVESGSSISVVAAASGVEPRFNYGIINLDGGTLRLNDSSAASYYNKSAASISLTGGGQLFTDSNLTFIN